MTEEEKAEMQAALTKAARSAKRADTVRDKAVNDLRELILKASAMGMRPSEISTAIGRRYSDGHLSRMINGKA